MSVYVEALDHVNIITSDLEGTARFYVQLLGLVPRDGPPPLTRANARWLYDQANRAVLHINSLDCPRTYQREVQPGPTGALHHVALRCCGYDELLGRVTNAGLAHQKNEVPAAGLRQIFLLDPNAVLLELNFFAT